MRSLYFDVLKGIAIIAVVLYHLGVCQYGYLGVDIFLVFAGYITMSSVYKSLNKNKGFKDFILSRVSRLLPLLLIASTFTLLFGSLFMLPDDLENLSQSIIATEFFGNNILQCITTHNYWDVVNEYKPLMHTWYVGLIMQYYLIIPFLYFLLVKNLTIAKKVLLTLNLVVLFFSLVLYLFVGEPAEKFYYLPYRLFEFSIGALFFEIQSIPFKVYPSKYIDYILYTFNFVLVHK